MIEPGRTIRDRRRAYALTQAQLAVRAGTTQAAISRIERGEVSPTVATLECLLYVMGEEAELTVRRMKGDCDPELFSKLRKLSPAERLEVAFARNRRAWEKAQAARKQ